MCLISPAMLTLVLNNAEESFSDSESNNNSNSDNNSSSSIISPSYADEKNEVE